MNRPATMVPAARTFGWSAPTGSSPALAAELAMLIDHADRANSVGARWPSTLGQHRQVQTVLLRILNCEAAPLRAFVEACRCFKASVQEDALAFDHARPLGILLRAVEDPIRHRDLSALIVHCLRRPDDLPSTACLAVRWSMSDRAVSCFLRRELGVAVPGLRIMLRCRLAAHALLSTDELVSQVAYQCGYEHPSQLNHDFDRSLGLTPGALREIALLCGIMSPVNSVLGYRKRQQDRQQKRQGIPVAMD